MYPTTPPSENLKRKYAKYLSKDEQVLVITGISSRYFWSKFMTYLPLALILIGLPKLLGVIHHKRSLIYILTNRRFLIIQGIFNRKLITAPLEAVSHVTVEQNFSERFFYNSGQLVIITAGYDQREIVIEDISNPIAFKILMEESTAKLHDDNKQESPRPEPQIPGLRPLKIS